MSKPCEIHEKPNTFAKSLIERSRIKGESEGFIGTSERPLAPSGRTSHRQQKRLRIPGVRRREVCRARCAGTVARSRGRAASPLDAEEKHPGEAPAPAP